MHSKNDGSQYHSSHVDGAASTPTTQNPIITWTVKHILALAEIIMTKNKPISVHAIKIVNSAQKLYPHARHKNDW